MEDQIAAWQLTMEGVPVAGLKELRSILQRALLVFWSSDPSLALYPRSSCPSAFAFDDAHLLDLRLSKLGHFGFTLIPEKGIV